MTDPKVHQNPGRHHGSRRARLALLLAAGVVIVEIMSIASRRGPAAAATGAAESAPSAEATAQAVAATAATARCRPGAPRPADAPATALETLGGVEVVGLSLSSSGAAVELRYRITDAEKARSIGARGDSVFLVDESTGKSVPMLVQLSGPRVSAKTRAMSAKMAGHLNGFPPATALERTAGQVCSILVPNLEATFRKGSRVSLHVDHLVADHLTVQ